MQVWRTPRVSVTDPSSPFRCAMFSINPVERSSRTWTRPPRASSSSARWLAMKPGPPGMTGEPWKASRFQPLVPAAGRTLGARQKRGLGSMPASSIPRIAQTHIRGRARSRHRREHLDRRGGRPLELHKCDASAQRARPRMDLYGHNPSRFASRASPGARLAMPMQIFRCWTPSSGGSNNDFITAGNGRDRARDDAGNDVLSLGGRGGPR
jgi:hypothetical protein